MPLSTLFNVSLIPTVASPIYPNFSFLKIPNYANILQVPPLCCLLTTYTRQQLPYFTTVP